MEGVCCVWVVVVLVCVKGVDMLIIFIVCEVLFEGLFVVKVVECLF